MPFWSAVVGFFARVGTFVLGNQAFSTALTLLTFAVGVKGYLQARDMLAKGQDIMANKVAAGGKLPIIFGNRRVGSQVVYMDTASNSSQHLFVVYALSVGEVDEIMLETLEIDGNSLNDPNQFRNGGYLGSDKIASGSGSLCTANQTSGSVNLAGGTFGTNPALGGYRYVFNAHHGAATQTADPMLVASNSSKWTSAHKLNGVAYIAASFIYDSKGQFSGVPQITVQVKGKKVYDQRKDSTNGGTGSQRLATPSTYEFSNNPAICFQDYILNNDYGKGIPSAKVNFSTFTTAANKADTLVDQPYFNGSAQTLNWSGLAGDNFISITGGINQWWQNKIGQLLTLFDANGNGVLDASEIRDARRVQFFDESEDFRIYIGATLGNSYSSQAGTSLLKVKRFQCNGYVDGNKTVMENSKELLANMRGVFLYVNGQYELNIEDTGSSTFSITDQHIISDSGISVDYGNKDKKANKVIVEFFNGNKKYELDTATVLHSATTDANDFTSDDSGEVLEIKAEFPFISDPYVAHNMGKAILTRSRNQTTVQFLGTPEMYKLNVNDIVTLTYAGLGFSGKVFRVEAMELQSNGLVSVSLIEYFDVYTWEVPPQEPVEKLANIPSAYAVKAPTGLAFTDTDSSNTSRPFLSWNLPTDFPTHQFRINIVNSAGNQVKNQIVDVNNADLNFLPVNANYVASVTSLNSTGVESNPATLTFTIGDAPTDTPDIKNNAITNVKINDLSAAKINTGELNLGTASGMAVKQGKTGYTDNSTTGLWLGNDGGTTKLNIGSSTKYLRFDGTNLFVAGDISASTGTISNSIAIGSGNNIFKADANGIYLGNATFGSAPFRVSMAGALNATNATISGSITATALNVTNATVTGTLDASHITLNNEPLDNVLSYSEVGGIGLLTLNEVANVNGDFVVNGDFEAVGSSPELVIGKVSSSDSHTDSATADIRLVSQQAISTIKIQRDSSGGLTTKLQLGYDPLSKALLSTDNLLKINTGGSLALTLDASQNAIFAGEVKSNALELVSSTPSTTTNKIYNVGGTLYFNGSAVGGGGTGDITSVVAGTNLNGGGTSGAVTLNLDNTISITGAISSGAITTSGALTLNSVASDTINFTGTTNSDSRGISFDGRAAVTADSSDGWLRFNNASEFVNGMFSPGGAWLNSFVRSSQFQISTTTVIDASRNLTNIGNIGSTKFNINNEGSGTLFQTDGYLRFANGNTETARIDGFGNITNIGTISSGAITSTGNLLLDVDNAEINLKSGIGTTSGAINWTFNTTGSDFASIKLPYATRATTGLHIDSGYPLTLDAASGYINFAINGNTRFRISNTNFEVGTTPIIDLNRNLTNINLVKFREATSSFYISPTNANTLNAQHGNTADTSDMWINYRGYADGFTKFRDFRIGNGKGSALLFVDGSDNKFDFQNGSVIQIAGTTVIDASRNLSNIGTISSGAITSTGTLANTGEVQIISGAAFTTHFNYQNGGNNIISQANGGITAFRNNGGDLFTIDGGGNLKLGTTQFIDASRNLTNIGTISSGAITSSGQILTNNTSFAPTPNAYTYLSASELQFGGNNNGRQGDSAQISAGQHQANSLNFVGMSTGASVSTRRMDFWVEGNAYFRGSVIATGNVTAFGSASDKRLKKDIVKIDNPIDKIKSVTGYEFAWNENAPKDKQDTREFGVIAQEVEKAGLDKLVFEYERPISGTDQDNKDLPDEKWKAVHYDKFVPILIEAIKDQQRQIDELNQRISA